MAAGFLTSFVIYDVLQNFYDKETLEKQFDCENCFAGPIEKILTANVLLIDGKWIKLSLIDTLEKEHSVYNESILFTARICKIGENAVVELDKWQFYDRSARNVAQVTCSGKILNEELLVAGHATISKDLCAESIFSKTD
ncbi:MAG: thermonuclease family protein [Candidatus Nitrosotenuis sp.]